MDRDPGRLASVIAVIGGGWAGCAAAVELVRGGYRVALHEAAPVLGGRARSVVRDGLALDNGEHLLLGAYKQTLELASLLHDDEQEPPWISAPLAISPFSTAQLEGLTLRTHDLPAPLGLLFGLLDAKGLALRERIATIRWFARQRRRDFRCGDDATVAELLADVPAQVRHALWVPLCVAALNTPPGRASAQVFLNVLREAFAGGSRAARMIVPRFGLAAAIPERAANWLAARGHAVHVSSRVRVANAGAGVRLVDAAGESRADAAIVAVGPHQLASAFDAAPQDDAIAAALRAVAAFDFEPITTVYLGYAAAVVLPGGLVRLDDAPGQWIFDRSDVLVRATAASRRLGIRSLLSVVISTGGAHDALPHSTLVDTVDTQLRRLKPDWPPLRWSQVIAERRATYACVPQLARPPCGQLAGRIYLAGDYTYPAYPATLEAAVRSGVAAARALMEEVARGQRASA